MRWVAGRGGGGAIESGALKRVVAASSWHCRALAGSAMHMSQVPGPEARVGGSSVIEAVLLWRDIAGICKGGRTGALQAQLS